MSVFKDYDQLTWVATIIGAHGIKGGVKVKYFTDTPDYYLNVELFFLEAYGKLQSLKVLQIRSTKSGWIILFEEVDSRNAAEKLRGCRLLLPDDQLRPLESSEVFVHQLIGCSVEDKNGRFLGRISEVLETGANNVYEVRNGKSRFMIPDVPHVVLELKIKSRLMTIDTIPGLMEEVTSVSDVTL